MLDNFRCPVGNLIGRAPRLAAFSCCPAGFYGDNICRYRPYPTRKAAAIPSTTSRASIERCRSRTSISSLVPAASPSVFLTAAQNASWAGVKTPEARAWDRAVDPGRAPGFMRSTSR